MLDSGLKLCFDFVAGAPFELLRCVLVRLVLRADFSVFLRSLTVFSGFFVRLAVNNERFRIVSYAYLTDSKHIPSGQRILLTSAISYPKEALSYL